MPIYQQKWHSRNQPTRENAATPSSKFRSSVVCLRSVLEPGGDDEAARIITAPRSDAVELSTKRGPPGGPLGGLGTCAAADSEDELWADTPPSADRAGVGSGFGDGVGDHAAEQDVLLRGGAEPRALSEPGAAGDVGAEATLHHDRALGQAPLAADNEQALQAPSQGQPSVQHSGDAGVEHSQGGPGVT